MDILYLQQELIMPGARGNRRCWEMAKSWTAAGHDVTFVSSLAGTPENRNQTLQRATGKHETIERDGITVHTIDVAFSHMMSFRQRVWSFLQFYRRALPVARKLKGFDLIIAYTAPLTVAALGSRLSQIHRIPFCLEVADVWPDVPIGMDIIKNRGLISWLNRRTNRLYSQASLIMPYTEGMRDQILSHGDFGSKTHVLHNGVDCDRVPFVPRDPGRSPAKVLYSGTIGKANDLSHFIRAAHLIESSGRTDIQFTILGSGNDEDRVRREVARLNVKSVKFLSAVPSEEVPSILQSADIGIACCAPFPVLEANGATKFFDYLASGLPIVLNYEGWQATYLNDRECGLSSPQGDDTAFANNIMRLVDDIELRKRFAINGRRLAEDVFDRRAIAAKTLGLLSTVHTSNANSPAHGTSST